MSAEVLSKEIINCLTMAEEGIHAVLFVLSVKNRISQEEEATLNTLQRIFEAKIIDYIIVVFTGGDELEDEGQTLDDYLRDGCPIFLTVCLRLLLSSLFFCSCGHDQYFSTSSVFLIVLVLTFQNVLRLCGQRKVLFDNKTKDTVKKAEQLKQLLAHVADVERQTDGIPYTDNMHRKIKVMKVMNNYITSLPFMPVN